MIHFYLRYFMSGLITINLELPTQPNDLRHLGKVQGASLSIALAEIAQQHAGLVVVIVADFATAFSLERELSFFEGAIVQFPDWETLPYDSFSPHQDIISQRLAALHNLPDFKQGILIIPISTLMHRLCPRTYIDQSTFILTPGDKLDLYAMRRKLEGCGYQYNNQVEEHGQFTVRGSILDIFPMGAELPYRIDLFDNEIDTIRQFDPDTQRSNSELKNIRLLPAREYPFTEEAIAEFRTNWRAAFSGDPRNCPMYQDVSQGLKAPGLEYYLPLFFANGPVPTLFDYLPEDKLIVRVGNIAQAADEFWQQINNRYEQYGGDLTRPLLEPKQVFVEPQDVFRMAKQAPQLQLHLTEIETGAGRYNLDTQLLPELSAQPKLANPLHNLEEFMLNSSARILFCAESAGRRVVLEELFAKNNIRPQAINSWQEFVQSDCDLGLTIAPLESGVILNAAKLAIITESELLGRRVMQRRRRKTKAIDPAAAISNLAELNIGDPVVHLQHGVGRYQGLVTLNLGEQQGEFVALHYANNDKLYIPVSSLHLISRYSGADLENAPMHSLGSDKWQREKRKAADQIRDVAAELLNIYAHRAAQKGHAFPEPDENYQAFANSFPFEETIDQQVAIEQVITDLTAPKPMDRVICGDVGFGKTEVAMRAAFLVAQSGKQVAVLVPTTLLAQQHYQTFVDRFSDFPFVIEVTSRFKTKKEQDEIEKKIEAGTCDIVIGTHKLLQKDVKFKNLGLLVIDEEHRFGVRQKEQFKGLRAQVDILTLTATPIPRTLNMSMSGIRDLSIISTPPAKRLSVKTFVRERSKALVQEAVNRELSRGGQVYYLHNEVETIETTAAELSEWLPNARIIVAHGQMAERELEQVMADFYHRKFNVLVCTTIIETGIDIPTANTIIMDRADRLGLAQLHQLRGRVGRSHHQAYAFCLTPAEAAITRDAVKRLEALESLDTLGAGFMLATHDLEIRGAGELLGEDQSGNLQTIGFSLFMELLEHTVKMLRAGKKPSLDLPMNENTEIDLQIPAFITDKYLGDVHTRLVLYKRISNAKNVEELDELRVEMIDRFGPIPEQTKNLFAITALKLVSENLGIKNIKAGAKGGKLEFVSQPNINPDIIIELIKANPRCYSFSGSTSIIFRADLPESGQRIRFVGDMLNGLSKAKA
jgi:transcription-repair coupling factor (superfamily II helicase)